MMHDSQWRSQGSQSGGDKQPRSQAAPKARTLYGGVRGPRACSPEKILKFRASETPFHAFWGEILQTSEDYNINNSVKNACVFSF
jgi:hypothetical protein